MFDERDCSGRLTFDFFQIESTLYVKLTKEIKESFNLHEASILVHGFDETFQDFKLDNKIVGLEWDIWSGYIVVAKNTEAEPLAEEIAIFIDNWIEKHNQKKS
jgi:hypothetical protein